MSGMARKNHQFKLTQPAAQVASMNLRSAMSRISALPVLARRKTGEIVRRRIPIVMYGGSPEPVKIRHVSQNVGSPVRETLLAQSPPP